MADRANPPKAKPFSVRLTEEEKALIRRKAGDTPLGAYLRASVLGEAVATRASPQPWQIKDRASVAQFLGLLGKSHLASNLNQLAKAANQGALPLTEETEKELRLACAAVMEMRAYLLAALGITKTVDGNVVAQPDKPGGSHDS